MTFIEILKNIIQIKNRKILAAYDDMFTVHLLEE